MKLFTDLLTFFKFLLPGAVDPVGTVGQACPTPGCHGIGHVRGPRYGTHYTYVYEIL